MGKNNKKKASLPKGKRLAIIAVSVFLGAVLLFGGVLGTLALVRAASAVVSYRGVTLDEGCVSYLSATYKTVFIRNHRIGERISESLWESPSDPDPSLTWGELLARSTESYIKGVAVKAYLFDRATRLTAIDRETIEDMRAEVLARAGSVSEFNKQAEPMGFTYSDYKTAMELIYKANRAMAAIYGSDGSALSSESYYGVCNEYFAESYTRVKILFIRTETDFKVDEDGNRIPGVDNKDELRELSESEKEKRRKDISDIRDAISALLSGGDGQMSPEYFDSFFGKYGYYPEYRESGFYFSPYSSFTKEFVSSDSGLLPVFEAACDMSVGEYREVECDFGVCFVYKCENVGYAYLDGELEPFFSDFYLRAAEDMLATSVAELAVEVEISEDFYSIDLAALPYNTYLLTEY